jgi:GxxExxY protein
LGRRRLVIELGERGMQADQQKRYDVRCKGRLLGTLIPDLIVDSTVIVDTKVVSAFNETHVAQTCLCRVSRLIVGGTGVPSR